jgi:hypothetical protein
MIFHTVVQAGARIYNHQIEISVPYRSATVALKNKMIEKENNGLGMCAKLRVLSLNSTSNLFARLLKQGSLGECKVKVGAQP